MIRRAAAAFLLFLGFIAISGGCGDFSTSTEKEQFPEFTNSVVDAAEVVPDVIEHEVDGEVQAYEKRSGNQIAVAVIETTGDQSLEDYTIDLAKKWGVGEADKDNGVLLLIAVEDRRLRIEVGEGIEGELTDLESGRIIREKITPLLRDGDYGEAVLVGTREIRRALGDQGAPVADEPPSDTGDGARGRNWSLGFLPFLLIPFIGRFLRRRQSTPVFWGGGNVQSRAHRQRSRRRDKDEDDDDDASGWLGAAILGGLLLGGGRRGGDGNWGGGDFGGGDFGGGGGGDFGGGGASGDW